MESKEMTKEDQIRKLMNKIEYHDTADRYTTTCVAGFLHGKQITDWFSTSEGTIASDRRCYKQAEKEARRHIEAIVNALDSE